MSLRGIVTSIGSRSCEVAVEGRGAVRCTLRGALWERGEDDDGSQPVVAGDRVELSLEGEGGVVESVAPRENRWARPHGTGKRRGVQVIAANLDRVVVVTSLADPPFRPGLVDRFLVAAAAQGLPPLLVLNKVDLAPDRSPAQPYRGFGVAVLETSCATGEGIGALAHEMHRGVSLLVGHSGVGKSSLLNAVSPGLALATGAVAGYHGRGRHTTTRVSLLPLADGGWVVDSPGIREFGVEDVGPAELARLYPGFGALPERCRFADCLHSREPGCAVRAALAAGELDGERHESYLRLLDEVQRKARPFEA